jgi:hypothetical protein
MTAGHFQARRRPDADTKIDLSKSGKPRGQRSSMPRGQASNMYGLASAGGKRAQVVDCATALLLVVNQREAGQGARQGSKESPTRRAQALFERRQYWAPK